MLLSKAHSVVPELLWLWFSPRSMFEDGLAKLDVGDIMPARSSGRGPSSGSQLQR